MKRTTHNRPQQKAEPESGWHEMKLVPPTRESFAKGFRLFSEAIRGHLARLDHNPHHAEFAALYDLYRGSIANWIKLAEEYLEGDPPFGELPKVGEDNNWYAVLVRLAEYCEQAAKRRPKLGHTAALIYEKLTTLPEHRAMKLPEIVLWLWEEHHINLSESAVSQKHLKQLRPWGLQRDTRIGFSIIREREKR